MLYEFSRKLICETDWTPPELARCGEFTADELAHFFDPRRFPGPHAVPALPAPFHAWPYNQEQIMKEVVGLGLAASGRPRQSDPQQLSINWLLMYSDLKIVRLQPVRAGVLHADQAGPRPTGTTGASWAPIVDAMIRQPHRPGARSDAQPAVARIAARGTAHHHARGAYDPVVAPA